MATLPPAPAPISVDGIDPPQAPSAPPAATGPAPSAPALPPPPPYTTRSEYQAAAADQQHAIDTILGTSKVDTSSEFFSCWRMLKPRQRDELTRAVSLGIDPQALLTLTTKKAENMGPMLLNRAADTHTLLHQLVTLAQATPDPKLPILYSTRETGAQLASEVAVTVANGFVFQGNAGTCGAESGEDVFSRKRPAEFARVALDLLTTGQARLESGDILKRNDAGIERDGEIGLVDAVYQGTLMNLKDKDSFCWTPDNVDGDHGRRTYRGSLYEWLPLWAKILCCFAFPVLRLIKVKHAVADGLTEKEIGNTLSSLLAKKYVTYTDYRESGTKPLPSDVGTYLHRICESGKLREDGIIVTVNAPVGAHAMVVDRIDYFSIPMALICRTWDLRTEQKGDHMTDFGPGTEVIVDNPARSEVRIPLESANQMRIQGLIVPLALDKKAQAKRL